MKKLISAITVGAFALSVACTGQTAKQEEKEQEEMNLLVLSAVAVASIRTVQGNCNYSAMATCIEYNSGWSNSTMTADCTAGGVLTLNTGCTSTNRVGSCAVTGRGGSTFVSGVTSTLRYYSPTYTSGIVQTACNVTFQGVFTAN